MNPSQLLDRIRSDYLERLAQAVKDHASDGIINVVAEAALRDREGMLVRRGEPPTPLRVDLVTLVNGEVRDALMVDAQEMPSFEPFMVNWENAMPVRIGPFPWNACPLRLLNVSAGADFSPLALWFESAFDPDETHQPDERGLFGVVHGLMNVPPDGDAIRFDVDFGSAPLNAFEGLLDALKAIGVGSVEIGTIAPGKNLTTKGHEGAPRKTD